jgi:hypothetical protein
MSPLTRSWFAAAFRFVLVLGVTLAVLLGTSLLCAIAAAIVRDTPVLSPSNVSLGLCCGLIVWLFVAIFHVRKETVSLPAPEPKRFLHNARILLTEMGYEVAPRGPHLLSTRPRFHSLLFGGAVQVSLKCGQAHLSGPKLCVEMLRNRLRVQSHLGQLQQTLREQHRHTETLIKRVELRLRVKPEDLTLVRTNVIGVLEESAEVVCELHLLAQSETGIAESVLEFQIGEWLAQQGIEATMHKHFIQLHRPLTGSDLMLGDAV